MGGQESKGAMAGVFVCAGIGGARGTEFGKVGRKVLLALTATRAVTGGATHYATAVSNLIAL
jgi:hypothetical protein